MSAATYLAGVAVLTLMVVPVAIGAAFLRRRLLPTWSGAPARLAECVLALGYLIGIGMLLGSFGQLRTTPVVVACVVVGLGSAALAGRHRRQVTGDPQPSPPVGPRYRRIMIGLAVLTVGIVLAQWLPHVVSSYGRGMLDGDTTWYHAPFAARFVQTGWVTRLLYTNVEPIVTFFPANGELVAGLAILPFHHDILLPAINLAWLALALLAGWNVGRPYGAGPLGMSAVAAVMSLPVMATTQAGTLRNDVIAVALFLSAVALVLNARRQPAALGIAGLAAGLAVGTKVDLIVPVVALLVGTTVVAVHRARNKLQSVGPLLALAGVGGSFWYVRNLVRTGNPLPWYGAHLGPLTLPAAPLPSAAVGHTAIVNHFTDHGVWGGFILPGLKVAFGLAWPALLVLAALGAVLALVERGLSERRMLGGVAVVTAVAYLFTPNTFPGTSSLLGTLFDLNLRYLSPALACALALLATSPILAVGARRLCVGFVLLGVVAVDQVPGRLLQHAEWQTSAADVALGVTVTVIAAAAVALVLLSPWRQAQRPAITTAAIVAVACVGWPIQRAYLQNRYLHPNLVTPVSTVYPLARSLENQRIALAGDFLQYPLTGSNLSNWVQFVGQNGPHGAFEPVSSCQQWRDKLREGHYQYVVIAPEPFLEAEPDELTWTRSDPGATEVQAGTASIFRLKGPQGWDGCT